MKHFTIFLFILWSQIIFAGNPPIKEFVLPDNLKVEGTFSGEINKTETFHLIVAKNKETGDYDILPFLYRENELTQLKTISFPELPSILSFHNLDDTLVLITSCEEMKKDVLNVVSIDLNIGKSLKSDDISGENLKAVLRETHQTLILFEDDKQLKILIIKNVDEQKTVLATPEGSSIIMGEIDENGIEPINKNEFVANGSIKKARAYAEENKIVLTYEDTDAGSTLAIFIPLDKSSEISFIEKKYDLPNNLEIKKSTSYVDENDLFQLKLNKETGTFIVFDMGSGTKQVIPVSDDDIIASGADFKGLTNFYKNASLNSQEPTLTINKTKAGNKIMRVDYVSKYGYNYSQQFMESWMLQMWQQQMMTPNMPKFGPSPYFKYIYVNLETSKHYFEILLNNDDEIITESDDESCYKFYDKEQYTNKLKSNYNIKHFSSVFLDDTFRYFAYDKRVKAFKVFDEKI